MKSISCLLSAFLSVWTTARLVSAQWAQYDCGKFCTANCADYHEESYFCEKAHDQCTQQLKCPTKGPGPPISPSLLLSIPLIIFASVVCLCLGICCCRLGVFLYSRRNRNRNRDQPYAQDGYPMQQTTMMTTTPSKIDDNVPENTNLGFTNPHPNGNIPGVMSV